MTTHMRPFMDMGEMGPGMQIFNQSPVISDLEGWQLTAEMRSLLLCRSPLSETGAGDQSYFGMPQLGQSWLPLDFLVVFTMWVMMMIAMMLPTASPMIMTYSDILANQGSRRLTFAGTGLFILGYLLVWSAFSVVAVLGQWLLLQSGILNDMMVSSSPALSAGLLIAAGGYQFSSLKTACLTHCRTPLQFFLSSWKPGYGGALRMGSRHGVYCVGCCWGLMLVMFFAGVMNLLWIAGLSLLMLFEKILPRGDLFGRLIGAALIVAGAWILGVEFI